MLNAYAEGLSQVQYDNGYFFIIYLTGHRWQLHFHFCRIYSLKLLMLISDFLVSSLTQHRTLIKTALAARNVIMLSGLKNLKCDLENVQRWLIDSAADVACPSHAGYVDGSRKELHT